MSRQGPSAPGQTSPVLDYCEEGYNTGTTVGTTAIAIPATNRSRRKGILIQNTHASSYLYIGAAKPTSLKTDAMAAKWVLSDSGTREYYLSLTAGASPIDQVVQLYTKLRSDSVEVKRSSGTVGSLSANAWAWAKNDGQAENSLYIATPSGFTTPDNAYESILSYFRMPATSGDTMGYKLGPDDAVYWPLSGATRVFGVSSSGNIKAGSIEFP